MRAHVPKKGWSWHISISKRGVIYFDINTLMLFGHWKEDRFTKVQQSIYCKKLQKKGQNKTLKKGKSTRSQYKNAMGVIDKNPVFSVHNRKSKYFHHKMQHRSASRTWNSKINIGINEIPRGIHDDGEVLGFPLCIIVICYIFSSA